MKSRPSAGGGHIVNIVSESSYKAQTTARDAAGDKFGTRICPTCLMNGLALVLEGMMWSRECNVVVWDTPDVQIARSLV